MIYFRFHEKNFHDERCDFEQWDSENHEIDTCGEPAVGFRGIVKEKRQYLCQEHFDLGGALESREKLRYEKEKKSG
jgi:hypothetical protein